MRLFRLIHIYWVFIRYNLDEMIFTTPWFYPLRFLMYFNPFYWILKNKLTRGERVRLAFEALGPIFIKTGQILSTRRDMLPDDIAEELAKLQDKVPPFPGNQAKQLIEKALGQSIEEVFQELQLEALASASVAQVHAATLVGGQSVVVKVLRPHIKKIIESDLNLLKTIASLLDRYSADVRRFKPKEVVNEIEQTLYDELDLLREGANASQLRRNFLNSDLLYIPEIHWEYCRSNVLVLERISGIPIYNVAALRAANMNLKKVAERTIELFFTQAFRDSFFHADLHPGNIFVSTENLENPKLIAVDFGIVGSLNTRDQRYLAENMLAFINRNYQRVAELHLESGWIPPQTRIDQFEGAIRAVCEPMFERPLKEISFGHLLLRLFQTARRFNINIQPQLVLLQKTLLNIEGLSRQIYPDVNVWITAGPFLEKWLKQQVGFRAFFRRIRDNLPYWSEKLPEIPGLIHEMLARTHQQKEESRFSNARATIENNVQKNHAVKYFILGAGTALLFVAIVLFSRVS